jgi:alpha-tubulin suppressor-like RCC1 family protein
MVNWDLQTQKTVRLLIFPHEDRNYSDPQSCDFSVKIDQIACGASHAAFIANGYIYAMGDNSDGRLGISKREIKHISSPCLVPALTRFD